MRNLLALVGLAVVAVVGLGWYLNWYTFKTEPGANGHRKIDVDVNVPKVSEDLNKGKEKIRDILSKDDKNPTTPGGTTPASFTQPFSAPPSLPPNPNKEQSGPVLFPPVEFPTPPPGSNLPPPPFPPQ